MLYDCRRTPAQSRPTASSPHPDHALEGDSDHQRSAPDAQVSRATARSESSEIIDIGSELRQARERLRRSLTDVAAALTIRRSHLAALEEGRLETLPGLTYALGFLRLYATALGLDADELVQRFKAAAGRVAPPAKLVFPTPAPARGAPTGAVALLGLVLAVGAYVAWYRLSAEGRLPAEVVPPVPARLAPLAEQAVPPLPPAAPVATAAQTPAAPPAPVAAPRPAPPILEISPTSAAAATPSTPTTSEPPSDKREGRVLVRARSDAWIQVRDKDGQILVTRILRAGESWPVPAGKSGLLLTTGNAGGTELVVDGVMAPMLGGNGTVRCDQPLDPDLIKEGKLPAQIQAASLAQSGRPPSP